jgi:hypothetical protein
MAELKPILETIEGVEESLIPFYSEKEDGTFVLNAGIDGLVENRNEVLAEQKILKEKYSVLETESKSLREFKEAKIKDAHDSGDLKQIVENLTEQLKAQQTINETIQEKNRKAELGSELQELAGELSKTDAKRQKAIRDIASNFVKHGDEGLGYEIGGVSQSREFVVNYIKAEYPFLVDGSSADGGGASGGGKDTGTAKEISREDFNKLDASAQRKAMIVDRMTVTD